jgi:hypothetical protein
MTDAQATSDCSTFTTSQDCSGTGGGGCQWDSASGGCVSALKSLEVVQATDAALNPQTAPILVDKAAVGAQQNGSPEG